MFTSKGLADTAVGPRHRTGYSPRVRLKMTFDWQTIAAKGRLSRPATLRSNSAFRHDENDAELFAYFHLIVNRATS
eukprot:6182348-Pleurochrysis_carterae.AAC.5